MKLSFAPVFPIWLIIAISALAVVLRVAAVVLAWRRGRRPNRRYWLRFSASVVAILCLALAATRLGDESRAQNPPRLTATAEESNINVFFVVDRSVGMTAADFDGDRERLAGALTDMLATLGKYPQARFAVLSYADEARVDWPLSPDTWSLTPFLENFQPYGAEYSYERGTEVNTLVSAPNAVLDEQLSVASESYPGSANLVYVFGAGSDPGDWAYTIPEGQVSGGAVFGYGTVAGAEVYAGSGAGRDGSRIVSSKLNEPALETAAQSLGIPYIHRQDGPLPLNALTSMPPQAAPADPIDPRVPHPNRIEYYWLFAALGAGLFGIELYDLARHWLRRRRGGAG